MKIIAIMRRCGLVMVMLLATVSAYCKSIPVTGVVRVDGANAGEGYVISDGISFATTDTEGRWSMNVDPNARFVFVIARGGTIARPDADNVPQFYIPVERDRRSYDFDLITFGSECADWTVFAIGDPQTKTAEQLQRLEAELLPKVKEGVDRCGCDTKFVILLGDITWDSPSLFAPNRKAFARLGIPYYAVIGNHDHDRNVNDDRGSEHNYCDTFGPTYYAFYAGSTLFVVLDNIDYRGNKKYTEQVTDNQIEWVKGLSQYCKADRVVVAMHAPLMKYWAANKMMTGSERLLAALESYPEVHFLTGHTHCNSNLDVDNRVVEHNVAQICGNLWWDDLNNDGTPMGYARFDCRDNELDWSYRLLDGDLQSRIRVMEQDDQVVATVWDWDTHWTVVWYEDGRYRGAMERFDGFDPKYTLYIDSLKTAGATLHSPQSPRLTNFLFRASPSTNASTVEVVATDRNGRRASQTIRLNK